VSNRSRRTRERIQACAMKLFTARGYDGTTISEIADAAGVSQMTLFRHFPSKADLVISDEYDPVMAESIAGQSAELPPLKRIHLGVRAALAELYEVNRSEMYARAAMVLSTPVLAKSVSESLSLSRSYFEAALAADGTGRPSPFEINVAAAVASACLNAAIAEWVRQKGEPDLLDLVDSAFQAICGGQPHVP
jgi:AcrR family transcriptional regulator